MKETSEPYVVARRFVMEQGQPNPIPLESTASVESETPAEAMIPTESKPLIVGSAQPYSAPMKLPNARRGQKTISLISAAGGVGKSATAVCLAGAIVKEFSTLTHPKKVVVVDLDALQGKVSSFLGQYSPTALSIRVMPTWGAETVLANLVHDKSLGIDALLAPVRPRNAEDVGPGFYRRVIEILQTTHDIVILVCPSNYLDPLSRLAFDVSDEILFVTTLAKPSVTTMSRTLKELLDDESVGGLAIPKSKIGIVANMIINNVGMGKDKLLLAALGCPLIGQIPAEYDTVLVAINQNKLAELLNHKRLGDAYTKLARMCLPEIPDTPKRRGYGLLVGFDDSRGNVHWIPDEHSHLLVGGKPDSGKTYFLQGLFKQITDTDSLIVAVSLNQEALSADISIWREASNPKSALSVIKEIEELMQSRYTLMQKSGIKNYKQLRDTPAVFLVIDEIDAFIDEGDITKVKIVPLLKSISMLGRAAGIHMVITTRRPEVIPENLRVHLDACLALGQMDEAYYEALTDLNSEYHLSSWSTDSPFPLASAKPFGEGVLRLGNNTTKVTIPSHNYFVR
jgi:Flp pilus assembly CpaE family ATPase